MARCESESFLLVSGCKKSRTYTCAAIEQDFLFLFFSFFLTVGGGVWLCAIPMIGSTLENFPQHYRGNFVICDNKK